MRWISSKVGLGIIVVAIVGWFVWNRSNKPDDEEKMLGIVKKGSIIQRVTISGGVVAQRTASLTTPYDGYVQKIFVKVGDWVKQGAPLVSVTQTPDGRLEEVFPLRAPFNGQIVQILQTEGANVAKSTNDPGLVRIDDTSKIFVVSDTPELDYPKLKIGQKAIIKASALPDRMFNGEIIDLSQAAKSQEKWDRSRVEFPIRVLVTDKDESIKPGMSATIDIITAQADDVLSLRHDYVGKDKEGYFVVQPNGDKKKVVVGMRSEDAFEIVSGVVEGEKLKQINFLDFAKSNSAAGGGRRRR